MSSPGSKRTYEATVDCPDSLATPQHQIMVPSESQAPLFTVTQDNQPSSRASTPLSSVPDHASTRPSSPPSGMKQAPVEPPNKKRKLTFAEKETLRIEKEFKAREKAEEKAKKDTEKAAKQEEKRLKAEEAEQKRKEKEVEREEKRKQQEEVKVQKQKAKEEALAQKEAEKQAKEEGKAKKDRSQMRLNAFFAPKTSRTESAVSSRRSSIASAPEESPSKSFLQSVSEKLEEQSSIYAKMFPPFFVHTHTQLAPIHRYSCDAESLAYTIARLDEGIQAHSQDVPLLKRTLEESSFEPFSKRRKLGSSIVPVKELISSMNGTATTPIDLESRNGEQDNARKALKALDKISMKYLRYAEDVRPPYFGTFTKLPTQYSARKLCRNPFTRALPVVEYDYDSEAEWEEPEEGEDLNSDDDEEELDDDDGDMEGFLDDEDAEAAPRRRNVMGDIEPVSTPLYWQFGSTKGGTAEVPYGAASLDLNQFRMAPLLVAAARGSIDPFSTAYWKTPGDATKPAAAQTNASAKQMPPPPRVPLNTLHGPNTAPTPSTGAPAGLVAGSVKPAAAAATTGASKPAKAAKPFPVELLAEFKQAIDGSDLSKVGLIEVLKKKFSQVTGKTISETLPMVAKREGKSVADKKWVLI